MCDASDSQLSVAQGTMIGPAATRIAPLIHIGHAKAASTWLQTHLLGNRTLGFDMPIDTQTLSIQLQRPAAFKFEAAQCRRALYPALTSAEDRSWFPVLSSENLSGRSRLGACNAKMIADRLADVFPAARILLVLREQKSMLLAQYHQYLR